MDWARAGRAFGLGLVVAGGIAISTQAKAAEAPGHAAAPYRGSDQSTYQSCAPHQVAPSCTATSSAIPHEGVLSVAASVDSGAGGNVPGAALSQATAALTP